MYTIYLLSHDLISTAGVGNAVASTDLVCDLIAKVIPLPYACT